MHTSELLVDNPTDHPLEVFCEPWAFSVVLPAGTAFRFVGKGEQPGDFEVERGESGITVYAWPSSTCIIYDGEQIIMEIPFAVPSLPEGMSVRGFVNTVFGKPK